jgi:putative flippase GtrA
MGSFTRYVAVGGTALGLHLVVLRMLLLEGAQASAASATGFAIACIFNYSMQRLWVFRSARSHSAALPRYVAITTTMLVVNTALFTLLYQAGLPPSAAQIATTGCVFLLNYFANRHVTFGATA